jgi:hypothetical protein
MPDPGASFLMARAANGKTQTMIRTSTLLIAATMVFAADGNIRAQTPLCGLGLRDNAPARPNRGARNSNLY